MMKKSAAGLSFAAAVGLSALSATPAAAVTLPFPNCDAAAAVGVYNIPAGTPGYGTHLDRDRDGVGCDAPGTPAYDASIVARLTAAPPQVPNMPVGGAPTGVRQDTSDNTGVVALGGGLVLAAIGGVFLVRRRTASNA
ncbi:excalibur calcium-binding domain-containing protein [Arthrobacter sp. ISL-28]|uniref:excalibur calcium-binding domain-containing protein n=1 Tax=Arthrobacter sp. ISL-28 TaxID=2819108 RepID=UPI001BECEDFB|nr:excalibur calcium-binding domain-containing protein [Arthrobacter sp. ISL-28]